MLSQAAEFDPARVGEVDMQLANFFRSQFGVQTMAQFGYGFRGDANGDKKSGTFALHTLKDDETIAKLATGIKRFTLPDEFNWIKIDERVAGRGKSQPGEQARDLLAQEYEDRRQYVKAAEAWKKAIEEYGAGHDEFRQKRLDQIVGNWGRFEPGADAAGRQEGHRRFPLPQRQEGVLRGPRHQGRQAARRREGLPQEQPRPTRLAAR